MANYTNRLKLDENKIHSAEKQNKEFEVTKTVSTFTRHYFSFI